MKTIILNIFSRILKLCRCVFLLDVYLFYVPMYVLQEIFPSWPIPFNQHAEGSKAPLMHCFMHCDVDLGSSAHGVKSVHSIT